MFIKGQLIESIAGGTYKGVVYDRSLRIKPQSNGYEIPVLDDSYPVEPISRLAQIGGNYEFLLMVTNIARNGVRPQSYYEPNAGHGYIIETDWYPPLNPEQHFHLHSPRLYHNAGGFAIVQDTIGQLLLAPEVFDRHMIQRGGVIELGMLQLTLLAIR